MPPKRARGYHYAIRRDGTKYRVYSGSGRKRPVRSSTGGSRRTSQRHTSIPYYGDRDVVMGQGAYRRVGRVRRMRMGRQAPRIANSNGRFIITHEEYLGDLNSASAFVNTAFALNPGIPLTQGGFSNWLPNVAQQFEQWKPLGMSFMFKSTSSDAVLSTAANSALGTVSMATDYNALSAPFASKVQMENYEHSVSTKPSNNLTHFVECARSQTPVKELYIRTGPVPTNADQRLYDLGLFQIAASGQQVSGGAMGELWVSYTIELLKPRIGVGIGGSNDPDVSFDHIQIYNSSKATAGVLPATPFGTSTTVPLYPTTQSTLGGMASGGIIPAVNFAPQPSPTNNNFLGGVPVLANGIATGVLGPSAANTYYFPPGVSTGNYMIQYLASWGVTGVPANPAVTPSNCKALNLINSDAQNGLNNDSSANTTTTCTTLFVTITRSNASLRVVGVAGATSPVFAEFFVTQIPSPID